MTGLLRGEGKTEITVREYFKLEEGAGGDKRREVVVVANTFMELLRSSREWHIG